MAKKHTKATVKTPTTERLILPDDKPVHLNMSFEEAIKKAVNTPIKNSKINRKKKG